MSTKKEDLTRLEDLSEFLHEVNAETNSQLSEADPTASKTNLELAPPPQEEQHDSPPDLPVGESSFDPDAQTDPFKELPSLGENTAEETPPAHPEEEISLSSLPESDSAAENNDLNFSASTDPSLPEFSAGGQTLSFDENVASEVPEQNLAESAPVEITPETADESSLSTPPADNFPKSPPASSETFLDLRNFSEAMTYGAVKTGGNPPYSIVLKNLKYSEDVQDILIVLKDHALVNADNEAQYQKSLTMGSLLIPQLSEYSAIFIAHKLRRFEADLTVGLSEEIRPPKNYQDKRPGLVSRENIGQNRSEMHQVNQAIRPQEVILSTASALAGKSISHYLGIVTEHAVLDETLLSHYELNSYLQDDSTTKTESSPVISALNQIQHDWEKNEEGPTQASQDPGLHDIYFQLSQKLRPRAVEMKGNAVIGINFQITPLTHSSLDSAAKYKITCSGSVVIAT